LDESKVTDADKKRADQIEKELLATSDDRGMDYADEETLYSSVIRERNGGATLRNALISSLAANNT